MNRSLVALVFAACFAPVSAQSSPRIPAGTLDFAHGTTGWETAPADTITVDREAAGGGRSVRLARKATSAGPFSVLQITLPVDFAGERVELRGRVKTEGATADGGARLWIVEDGEAGRVLAFDNMQERPVVGTTDWTEHVVGVTLAPEARTLRFGVLLAGPGTAWAAGLRLLVDGRPIDDVPVAVPRTFGAEHDHAFDGGSQLTIASLSATQVDNLVTLANVWGFLKYHDRRVTSGDLQWDYALFRILPTILAQPDRAAAQRALVAWIDGLGPTQACTRCASLDVADLQTAPALEWITDRARLEPALSERLTAIHRQRSADSRQYYLSLASVVGNPSFDHESDYQDSSLDDAGFRLLAAFRFWNIVAYWFPYRDLVEGDRDAILADALPRIVLAPDAATYQRELMALVAHAGDTHANLWSSIPVRPPTGACRVPVNLRFVEGDRLVVAASATAGPVTVPGLAIGDEIVAIDGRPVADLVIERIRFYAVSNAAARRRDMARQMTHSDCVPARLAVRGPDGQRTITADRVPIADLPRDATHDRPGPAFQRLSNDVAYLKLSSIEAADVPAYLEAAAGTRGLVIDLRDYPSDYVVLALGNRLVDRATPFVRFTRGDPANPGAFHWAEPTSLVPAGPPSYRGQVVILVDEVSQSQAEYTAMALRAAPGAIVVGSTTAGADGNVSTIPLPGRLSAMVSGIGIFHPDRRPTQRVGIVPDVVVEPTIAGLRAGRDEVLEAGIARIVGADPQAAR